MVVRGYITGVTDTRVDAVRRRGSPCTGTPCPTACTKNSRLDMPIITPTTKAEQGGHDVPLLCRCRRAGTRRAGPVGPCAGRRPGPVRRGRASGERSGLILADTKYEFGLTAEGELLLIDEVHTPDSSRWWVASTYEERIAAGAEPESLDKEVVRRALADIGYTGDGPVPELSSRLLARRQAQPCSTTLAARPAASGTQRSVSHALAHEEPERFHDLERRQRRPSRARWSEHRA